MARRAVGANPGYGRVAYASSPHAVVIMRVPRQIRGRDSVVLLPYSSSFDLHVGEAFLYRGAATGIRVSCRKAIIGHRVEMRHTKWML